MPDPIGWFDRFFYTRTSISDTDSWNFTFRFTLGHYEHF